jgi:hypothetical protein
MERKADEGEGKKITQLCITENVMERKKKEWCRSY